MRAKRYKGDADSYRRYLYVPFRLLGAHRLNREEMLPQHNSSLPHFVEMIDFHEE